MRFFVSYAKKDTRTLALALADALEVSPHYSAWVDKELKATGSTWTRQIESEIERCDCMIVLLSPDVNRRDDPKGESFVRKEIEYAINQGKESAIVVVMAQMTTVPLILTGKQYIDFRGQSDAAALADGICEELGITKASELRAAQQAQRQRELELRRENERRERERYETEQAAQRERDAARQRQPQPSVAPPATQSYSPAIAEKAPLWRNRRGLLAVAVVLGLIGIGTFAASRSGTVNPTLTPTETLPLTPIPNVTASVDAFLMTRVVSTATAIAIRLTQTATLWTPTYTVTPINTPLPTPTSNPTVTANNQWTPQERTINDVTMMVVPPGCFTIGSNPLQDNEKNGNQVCFAEAFLIDKTEVTQAQFRQFGGKANNPSTFRGDNRPVENITWFEARDFCAARGARLPTEAEWEYVARGPDGVEYPWGSWDPGKAVWNRGVDKGTANVGSIPEGASWVGALDMSGNVWEWTSSIHMPYPYDAGHGRESTTDTKSERVMRGSSWYLNVPFLRGAFRGRGAPNLGRWSDGFRCARSLP